jgi:hypothetical protein
MSGGLITNRCAAHAIEDALKNAPEGSAEGVAAKIKQSEAEAKARRAAVRFLGTVDCSRFPDAQAVLIASLEDTNECVRYEAALAFLNGCCCNKDTVKALTDVVAGKTRVPETSERVKAAAADALSQCEVVIVPTIQQQDEKKVEELKKVELTPAEIIERARDALARYRAATPMADPAPHTPSSPRPTSVAAILSNAFTPGARTPVETAAPPSPEDAPAPAVLNAVLTSQSNGAAHATTTPAAPAPAPVSTVAPAERRPFFDGLTRALKGKQHTRAVLPPEEVHQDISAAPPTITVESQVHAAPRLPNTGPALPLPVGTAAPRVPAALPMLPGFPR